MATSQSSRARMPSPPALPEITLRPTRPMAEALDRLCNDIGVPIEEVMSQAVALLMFAVDAQKRGQRLCLADDDLKITGEIVGFGAESDEIGIDPFPEADSDRLDG
jgi:hypothetical protein